MSQIVHIFRKDCRRLWQTIAAVLVFTFLHGYGDALDLGGGAVPVGISTYELLFLPILVSGVVLPIVVFMLVVSVIQEESLVGSDKFWLTRPYSRRSLALEKLLFVVVWVILPVLLHDVMLIRHFGFSLSSAFGLLLWKNTQFVFFLLVAAAVAVLSESFARAVLLAIAVAFVNAVVSFIIPQGVVETYIGTWRTAYEFLIVLIVAAVGALCIIAFQYRFRITAIAASIGVLVVLVCALLARFWPASLSAYLLQKNEAPLLRSVQLIPDGDIKDLPPPPEITDASTQARVAYYPFGASGLASDVGVQLVGITAHFNSPGQTITPLYLASMVRFQPRPDGSRRFANGGGPEQLVAFAPPALSDYDRLKDTDGALSGHLVLQGFRSEAVRVPVPPPTKSQDFAVVGRRCRVQSFVHEPKTILNFYCVELEPGDTSGFDVRFPRDLLGTFSSASLQCQGQTPTPGSWPGFLSPIVKSYSSCELTQEPNTENSTGESTAGPDVLVFAEQSLGAQVRTFRIEHFRPADLTLQDWERRGVLRAGPTNAQSNGGTPTSTQ